MTSGQSPRLRQQVQETAAVGLLRLFSLLPLPVNHLLGAAFGFIAYLLPTNLKRITRINLKLCFPEKDPAWHRRMTRKSLQESGKAFTEAAYLWWAKPERLSRLVKQTTGKELLDKAMQENNGALYAVPHNGCWEMCGLYVAAHYPMSSLYRPMGIDKLDNVIRHARQTTGATLVPTNARGVKALLKALQDGQCIGILPDQVPQPGNGVHAPLFGIEAYTMVLLTRLAAKHKTPVIFSLAERLPWGRGYHIKFMAAPEAIHDTDPVIAATATNQGVENVIRECPEQYIWSYKRFKDRPEGEPDFYRRQ